MDEFCKEFDKANEGHILQKDCGKKSRKRAFCMTDSEVITIMIYFHLGQFRNLKHFYINYIQAHCKGYFPNTVSYNRFVELMLICFKPYLACTTLSGMCEICTYHIFQS